MVRVDRRGPGRGAWLCGVDCLPAARRRGGFDRAFRRPIGPAQIEELESDLTGSTLRRQGVVGIAPVTARLKKTTKG